MRRYLFAIVFGVLTARLWGAAFDNESLHYVISYKWGLIHKDAGDATLTLKNRGDNYEISLTGKTRPWADRVFKVRDTLYSRINKQKFLPVSYIKISHEGGKYGKDELLYSYDGDKVTAHAKRYKDKGGKISSSEKTFTDLAPAFDMGSIFYYLRTLDFSHLKTGEVHRIRMFSGSKKETLTVKNLGVTTVKLRDGSSKTAFHISFNFTTDGKKKSSDDIDAWLSTDRSHVPYLVEGSLPIGKIRCQLSNLKP